MRRAVESRAVELACIHVCNLTPRGQMSDVRSCIALRARAGKEHSSFFRP